MIFIERKVGADTARRGKRDARGWTLLGSLAESRRGIATGSNSFFLISSEAARRAEIADQHLRSCVGKANDVSFSVFRKADSTTSKKEAVVVSYSILKVN